MTDSCRRENIRRCIEHHLHIGKDIIANNEEYHVAKHHWDRKLLGHISHSNHHQ